MKTVNGTLTVVVVVVALLVVVAANAFYEVPPATRALLFQFGRIVSTEDTPGLHVKIPFVQGVQYFDGRILTLDNQTQTFATSDQKNLEIGYYAKWKVADPETYYRATGGQELVAMDRLSAILGRGLTNEFAKTSEAEIIAGPGRELLQGLGQSTRDKIATMGVTLVDLRIGDVQLPAAMLKNVYARMRSERERVASDLRAKAAAKADALRAGADAKAAKVLADAHLKAEQIRGEGDAQAARIYAAAYAKNPQFLRFYRSLETYRTTLAKQGDVLVLRPGNGFLKYLDDAKADK